MADTGQEGPIIPPWDDWDPEIWTALRAHGQPLAWTDAQRLVGAYCRANKLIYGRDSKQRTRKFAEFMQDLYGENWETTAHAAARAESLQKVDEAVYEAEGGQVPAGLFSKTPDEYEQLPDLEPAEGAGQDGGAEQFAIHSRAGEEVHSNASFGDSTLVSLEKINGGIHPFDVSSEDSTLRFQRVERETEVLSRHQYDVAKIASHVQTVEALSEARKEFKRVQLETEFTEIGPWAIEQLESPQMWEDEGYPDFVARVTAYAVLAQRGGYPYSVREIVKTTLSKHEDEGTDAQTDRRLFDSSSPDHMAEGAAPLGGAPGLQPGGGYAGTTPTHTPTAATHSRVGASTPARSCLRTPERKTPEPEPAPASPSLEVQALLKSQQALVEQHKEMVQLLKNPNEARSSADIGTVMNQEI